MRANQSLSMYSLEPFIATVALGRETYKATSTTRLVRHPIASTLLAAISPARLGIQHRYRSSRGIGLAPIVWFGCSPELVCPRILHTQLHGIRDLLWMSLLGDQRI